MCCPACPTGGASSATAASTASGKPRGQKPADPVAFGNLLAEQLKSRETQRPTQTDRVERKLDRR